MKISKVIVVFIMLSYVVLGFSQTGKTKTDSLQKILPKVKGKKRFEVLNALTDQYSNFDLVKAEKYGHESLAQAEELHNSAYKALALNALANVFQYKTMLDSALIYHRKALICRKQNKDTIGVADSYNNIGIAYDQKGNFQKALENYFTALKLYDSKHDLEKQAMVCTNIGIVYKAQKDFQKALTYYKKSLDLYTKSKNDFGITVSSGNIGSIYINFKNYNESLRYSQMAKKGYEKLGYDRYIPYPLSNMAVAYDSLKRFKEANFYYKACIDQHEQYGNGYEVADMAVAYANCLFKQKRIQEALLMAEKGIMHAKKAKAKLLETNGYRILSKAFHNLGNDAEAFKYAHLYAVGKDSLFETEKTKALFELDAKYQTAEKEKQLLVKEAESARKANIIMVLALFAFLVALTGFFIYRQQKLKNTQQKQEFELKSAIAEIESQNRLHEQRLAISRDLHDNIGAQLTFVISSVENLKFGHKELDTAVVNQLSKINDFTRSTIIELRDTIWAMNHNEFSWSELRDRLTGFISKARSAKEDVILHFTIDSHVQEESLSAVKGINVYRVIQEAVNNALKYADAKTITVAIFSENNQTVITIHDDGIGFDVSRVEMGNGISNMRKRTEEFGGQFLLESNPNNGTIVKIIF